MSEEMNGALTRLQNKLQLQLDQVKKTKSAINAICEAFDQPPLYTDVEQDGVIRPIRPDQFYGLPLATCVRSILEDRRATNRGAGSVNELFDALKSGGYAFDTKDDENAKASLRQSLRKNPVFHKLPGGQWGLLSWYPNARQADRDEHEDADAGQPTDKTAKTTPVPPPTAKPGTVKKEKKPDEPVEAEKAASVT